MIHPKSDTMKKDRLSMLVLAIELAAIVLLHSSRLNSSDNAELTKKGKVEQITPADPNLLLSQLK